MAESESGGHGRRMILLGSPSTQSHPGEATAADVVETIAGHVKWFDVAKGYGFIVPEQGGNDVLVHVTILKRDGFFAISEGARMVVEAVRRTRGYQALRVVSLDNSVAVHPAEAAPARTHVQVSPAGGFELLTVKWFNRLRGFGFASKGDNEPDVFVHMETLRRFGIAELQPGDQILVRYGPGPKGLMAAEIRLPQTDQPSSH
jgi:CspA family cold shock protein